MKFDFVIKKSNNFAQMPQDFIAKNLGVILASLFLWLVGLSFVLAKIFEKFSQLTRGTKTENLIKVLAEILKSTKQNEKQLEKLETSLGQLQKETTGHLQKVSLLRFNPFGDVGGDQSFVVTFLDGENSGLIVSSLHSRQQTRVYAKPIEKGTPKQGVRLSDEEVRGLKAAIEAKNA